MPLTVIKGSFQVLGTEPDGDSVRFYPDDPQAFRKAGLAARVNQKGGAQLRLDAIDALETHYMAPTRGGGLHHQPLALAHAAADELLTSLGFTSFTRDGEVIVEVTPPLTRGYILTRFADIHGRPVAFTFAGESEHADLSPVFMDVPMLERSLNHRLIRSGLAYPTFYSRLFPDLRAALSEAADQARAEARGIWPEDATTSGAQITSVRALNDTIVLVPKLFRRLIEYLTPAGETVNLDLFPAFLEARGDRLLILPTGHVTGFDSVVAVEGQTVRLTERIEDLVFFEA